MKYTLILLLYFISPFLCAKTVPENPYNYFDFWLGKWEATWDEVDGKKGKGINTVKRILNGQVIKEDFRITQGQSIGFNGLSFSLFHQPTNSWKQSWVDNQGGFYYFTGKLDGEKRIFQTEIFNHQDGRKLIQRMVFYDIKEESMIWDWETSENGGVDWNLAWRIYYKRID